MASPQIENGYTKIANELFEALCRIRIPGEARQVFDVITRKTYGYNKVEDQIALSQISLATGLRRSNVCRALNTLISINLIIKKETGRGTSYKINKDFESWKPLSNKRPQSQKREQGSLKTDNKLVSKERHTKERKKITKETSDVPSQEVVQVIKSFEAVNPSYEKWYENKTQRAAAKRLISIHGLSKVLAVIKILPKSNLTRYLPSVTEPLELENKWAKLAAGLVKLKVEQQEKVNPIII